MHVLVAFVLLALLLLPDLGLAPARILLAAAAGRPLRPGRRILGEQIAGENAIARRVLDIDVKVIAGHRDDDVEVDLHIAGDIALDGEDVRGFAGPPAGELRGGEVEAESGEGDSPDGAVAGGCEVGLLGFGWVYIDQLLCLEVTALLVNAPRRSEVVQLGNYACSCGLARWILTESVERADRVQRGAPEVGLVEPRVLERFHTARLEERVTEGEEPRSGRRGPRRRMLEVDRVLMRLC